MVQRREKKLVYVNPDLLEEAAKASQSRGETVTKFLEEALAQAVKVTAVGYDLEQSGEFFEVMQAQRILGGTFVPLAVLEYLTELACRESKEQLGAVWFESGKWHGKYLKERFSDSTRALERFLWASRWDLSEVQIKRSDKDIRIRCVSTVLTEEATDHLAQFVRGIMEGIGYHTIKSEVLKGMIVQDFKQ
ncbi:MAG: hypothetical protein LBH74_07795 [Nitrososphaerota archaeon]|jgi:hypothetical protein|uniref:hypothetical protein n=1 Tax=Candidatus Bathycorpusculum sp. TaxID=2994959 RepID=UPI00282F9CE9|nr:hypothetical protein [Candidatus Termitimicrobium sp.]MCL2431421.1 hypothetical protein [Candidatus Termitimicrobium sp.]MDR0493521.1 hypothetical protein [Nitrososphaerota archaeon]